MPSTGDLRIGINCNSSNSRYVMSDPFQLYCCLLDCHTTPGVLRPTLIPSSNASANGVSLDISVAT